jgi:hypothetical protein
MEKDVIMARCWIKENQQAVMLSAKLQREGFDVKAIIRDALQGQVKPREHYRIGRG